MSSRLAGMLRDVESAQADLVKGVDVLASDQVPLYELETVLLAVAMLASRVRDQALAACAEAGAVRTQTQPESAESNEATRRFLSTLLAGGLAAGNGGW